MRDQQADDRVGQRETGQHADRAEHHGQRGEPVGAGVQAVGDQRRGADPAADPDPVDGDQLVAGEPDQRRPRAPSRDWSPVAGRGAGGSTRTRRRTADSRDHRRR